MKVFISFILSALTGIMLYKYKAGDVFYYLKHIFKNEERVFELASVDISDVENNFDQISKELVSAFREVGFAYITGVSQFDEEELLSWTKWFFQLSHEKKLEVGKQAFNEKAASVYRGYYPLVPGGHSYKEAFETGAFQQDVVSNVTLATAKDLRNLTVDSNGRPFMRNVLLEKNNWPISGDAQKDCEFRRIMQKYYRIYNETSSLLFQLCVRGLGFNRTQFDHMFGEHTLSTLRLIRYPSRLDYFDELPDIAKDGHLAITTGAHQDSDMLTVLSTFENKGLQIRPPGYTKWLDVPSKKNHFVVNVGALLTTLVEGQFVATEHRVLDIGLERFSVPMFFEPHFDANVKITFYNHSNHFVGNIEKYGPWMTNRTSQFVEYATTDFGVLD